VRCIAAAKDASRSDKPSAQLTSVWLPCYLLHSADEIDAIGTKRYDSHSGGEREIQRTMLELLNQMDGFDALSEVKVGVKRTDLGGVFVVALSYAAAAWVA
jgi:hypothetical protein